MLVKTFPETGGVLCLNQSLSFEAIPAFDYGSVHVTLTGPGVPLSRTDWVSPYLLFANRGGYSDVFGRTFVVGNYTLHVASNNPENGNTIKFQVDDC